jgi:hypothetical protein
MLVVAIIANSAETKKKGLTNSADQFGWFLF